jgi:hypothetical protein
MGNWYVSVTGKQFDLEEYLHWFPHGNIYVSCCNNHYKLRGKGFSKFESASQVFKLAKQIVDEFYAVLSILVPSIKKLKIDKIGYKNEYGEVKEYAFASGKAVGRSKSRANITIVGQPKNELNKTQAQTLYEVSQLEPRLKLLTLLWANENRTWPLLYRIIEEIEEYLGHLVSKEGLCSLIQRRRFTGSAIPQKFPELNQDTQAVSSIHQRIQ